MNDYEEYKKADKAAKFWAIVEVATIILGFYKNIFFISTLICFGIVGYYLGKRKSILKNKNNQNGVHQNK